MWSNSEVPQSSVLVPFKICMCDIKKSGNVNRPLVTHSVLDEEGREMLRVQGDSASVSQQQRCCRRLEVGGWWGFLLSVHVIAMGGLACCTPYLEECRTLKTSDDAPP